MEELAAVVELAAVEELDAVEEIEAVEDLADVWEQTAVVVPSSEEASGAAGTACAAQATKSFAVLTAFTARR